MLTNNLLGGNLNVVINNLLRKEEGTLTDSKKLRAMIQEAGLKYNFIASKLNITPYGLKKKIDNESEFKASEIDMICEILSIGSLKLKDEIFFKPKVD